jgi:hypothetical protein
VFRHANCLSASRKILFHELLIYIKILAKVSKHLIMPLPVSSMNAALSVINQLGFDTTLRRRLEDNSDINVLETACQLN